MSYERIAPVTFSKHAEVIMWVNALIIDLELQLGGIEPSQPITMERVQEWRKLRESLDNCRESMLKY